MPDADRSISVDTDDPLFAYLSNVLFCDTLGYPRLPFQFTATNLDSSGVVVRYDEKYTFTSVVVKFYGLKWLHGSQSGEPELRAALMRNEYENLRSLRAFGFDSLPHRIVRPLAISERMGCALVEDYAPGRDLDAIIRDAINSAENDELPERLGDIAWFLADLHNRTEEGSAPLNPEEPVQYLTRMANQLRAWGLIDGPTQERLAYSAGWWRASGLLDYGKTVLIHGDAVPAHFRFSNEHDLTVIDLERCWRSDPAADLGRLAAELKHAFAWYRHEPSQAEPYISHLYDRYAWFSPRLNEEFGALTTRGGFYMGCAELRISRNHWLNSEYRQFLIQEAMRCLQC